MYVSVQLVLVSILIGMKTRMEVDHSVRLVASPLASTQTLRPLLGHLQYQEKAEKVLDRFRPYVWG